MQPNCLYIAYRPEWGDNRARDVLHDFGWTVEVRCPARGDVLPDSAAAFSGVIIGGGLDDVIEASRPAYVDRLITLTRDCLERGTPFIGFCFGAQVLASAGGGQVLTRADGLGAYGYRRIEPSGPAGRAALAGLDHACHLHYHGFEAPVSAVRLAAGTLFPDSAFRLGNRAWGFQFHPEIRADQLEVVLSHLGEEALARDGADARERQLRDAARYDAGVQAWLARFLREWCAAA